MTMSEQPHTKQPDSYETLPVLNQSFNERSFKCAAFQSKTSFHLILPPWWTLQFCFILFYSLHKLTGYHSIAYFTACFLPSV